MDAAAVLCSRSEFDESAQKLSAPTAWEVRSRQSLSGAVFQWLEATYDTSVAQPGDCGSVLITVRIIYNPDFRVPQLGFSASTLVSVNDLRAALPHLSFMNAVPETSSGAGSVSKSPLVSCSWSEEVQKYMWLVHPCDTENLIRCSRYSGVRGDVLATFVQAMSVYFPFVPSLLPPA